jgi:hypothetical protein
MFGGEDPRTMLTTNTRRGKVKVNTVETKSVDRAARGCWRDTIRRMLTLAACTVAGALVVGVAGARAEGVAPEITSFDVGLSSLQAGAHADVTTAFQFATTTEESSNGMTTVKGGTPKTISVAMPKGVVADVAGIPQCTSSQFESGLGSWGGCPVVSQVGTASIKLIVVGNKVEQPDVPVFNMAPSRGKVAKFGFAVGGYGLSFVTAEVENGDEYRISAGTNEINDAFPVFGVELTLWGVPGAEANDPLRMCADEITLGCKSPEPPRPFMTNGGLCGVAEASSMRMQTYQNAGIWATASAPPITLEGCENQPFDPTIDAAVEPGAPASASGLDFDLNVPQTFDNPDGISAPPLRRASVTLPAGFSISPGLAQGLDACTDEQLGVGREAVAACPLASRIGEVTVNTPLLDESLSGGVYVGTQLSDDPASGEMYRMDIEVTNAERGVFVKLPGKIYVDPTTGQITAVFDESPQLPFETLHMHLKSGPRAPISTPRQCGTYSVQAQLMAWSGQVADVATPLRIDQRCDTGAFEPRLSAGTVNPVAGSYSPFILRVTSDGGPQNVSTIEAALPKGLLAKLAAVPLCGDARAASGSCPEASEVGTTTVGAGPGSNPIYVPQPDKAPTGVYLAGPYKGAPYSLVVKVPAQAGPFDLGTVVVRNGLYVDSETTQVTARSDALPQILKGIPITYRDIRVVVDRPDFIVNPTNCDPMSVDSRIGGSGGATADPRSRFQVAGCDALPFAPKLKLQLKGATRRIGHPALKAVLTARPGEAGIARAQVNLPHGEFLDQGNLNKTCTKPVLLAGDCPASSIYGRARAFTPLLDRPLEGPVYLVGGYGYKLPALVADLNGQIRVTLVGKVDSGPNKGIRNTFEVVPDAPVSRFVLEMKGGKKYGLLENSENLCKAPKAKRRAIARFTGQNGKVAAFKPLVRNQCGKGAKKHARHGRAR